MPGSTPLPLINSAYLIDPFTASPVDYQSVLLTWSGPDFSTGTTMSEFRLLSSRYGFPVDENDGNVLFDTTSHPGNQYVDQNVVPGQMTYYGFYILGDVGQWIRAGFTACLMPADNGYGTTLWNLLPEYLRDLVNGELTADATGDSYLSQWLNVAGWSLDYLQTQYDFLYNYQNDPMHMSFSDLAQLAGELGMPFSAEIPAYSLRKAADNWATVMRQRGSVQGIAEHVSLLSGFGADIQVSRNIMLENDQSDPSDPRPGPWSAGVSYNVGEMVTWPVYPEWVGSQAYVADNYVVYNGTNYQCIATGGQGVPPAGAVDSGTYWAVAAGPYFYVCIKASGFGNSPPAAPTAGQTPTANNTWWQLVYDFDSMPPYRATQEYTLGQFVLYEGNLFVCIVSSVTGTAPPTTATSSSDWAYVSSPAGDYIAITGLSGGESTWEVLYTSTGSTTPSSGQAGTGTLLEGIGLRNPGNFTNDFSQNSLRVTNVGSGTVDQWLRSVSRDATDISNGATVPDPQLVVEHGIPVPQVLPEDAWNPDVRYSTGTVVSYQGLNYLALRASTGATPPSGPVLFYDFEGTNATAGWTTQNGATLSQGTPAYHGSYSLEVTAVESSEGYNTAYGSPVDIIPGATYEITAWAYSAGGWSGGVAAQLSWGDVAGYLSSSTGSTVALAAGTWTKITCTAVAPLAAINVAAKLLIDGVSSGGTTVNFDLVSVVCLQTPEWQPLGLDSRVPLVVSAETIQDVSVDAAEQYAIFPFAEFYDNWGNLITRAFARTPAAGTPGMPANYTFDSFTTGVGTPLAGRETDTGDQSWDVTTGAWMIGPGIVYPAASGASSVAIVAAPASCTQAVTFETATASTIRFPGIVFWYQGSGTYWYADMTSLYFDSSGTLSSEATFTEEFEPGDRIYVVTNATATGSTAAITVYRNAVQAYSSATGNGQVAQVLASALPSGSVPTGQSYSGISYQQV